MALFTSLVGSLSSSVFRPALLLSSLSSLAAVACVAPAHAGSDGRLDQSFGNGGVVTLTTDFAPSGVTALPDGGVVLSGVFLNEETAALVRLDADGALVESWGENGIVRMPTVESLGLEPGFAATRFSSVFLLDDGRWLVSGSIENWVGGPSRICPLVAALNADGGLDTTFGGVGAGGAICVGGGSVQFSSSPFVPGVPGAVVDRGRLYVADSRVAHVAPARVHAVDFAGNAVAGFGVGGTVDMPPGISALSLDVDAEGALFAGSLASIAKFSMQGSLDASFGEVGVASLGLPAPWEVLYSAKVRVLNDRLVALGGIYTPEPEFRSTSFARMVWNLGGEAVPAPHAGEGPPVVGLSAWSAARDSQMGPYLFSSESGGLLDRGGRSIIMAQELMRLTSEGSPDPRFGTGGRASIGWTQPAFQAVGMDSDSRLWLARQQHTSPAEGRFLEVLRYLAGGLFSDGFEPEAVP